MIVVIPSARRVNLTYLEPLIASGARFIVVDDSDGSIVIDHPQFEVYTWRDRRRLGELEVAIPRGNGACRDFGFYIAWMEADDDEVIVALDDDCQVLDADFADSVLHALAWRELPMVTGSGEHWNVLDLYEDLQPPHPFPRGFPYSHRLGYVKWTAHTEFTCQPVFNLGLWQGVFDVNAVDKLALSRWSYPAACLSPNNNVAVPSGVLVSACSMNMHFRRAVIPALYQLPMKVKLAPGLVIDRYGDIWGGFILKTLMDVRGDRMSVGAPMIYHAKEGSFTKNIHQENLCHIANDDFLAVLRNAAQRLRPASYLDMMAELCELFTEERDRTSPIVRQYLDHLHVCLGAWVRALRPGERAHLRTRRSVAPFDGGASALA